MTSTNEYLAFTEFYAGDIERIASAFDGGLMCGQLETAMLDKIVALSGEDFLNCSYSSASICHEAFPSGRTTSVQWIREERKTLFSIDNMGMETSSSQFNLSQTAIPEDSARKIELVFSTLAHAVDAAVSIKFTPRNGNITEIPDVSTLLLAIDNGRVTDLLHQHDVAFSQPPSLVSQLITHTALHDGEGQSLQNDKQYLLKIIVRNRGMGTVDLLANINLRAKLANLRAWPNCNDDCLTENFCQDLCQTLSEESCHDADSRFPCTDRLANANRCLAACRADRCDIRFSLIGASVKHSRISSNTDLRSCPEPFQCLP